MPIVKVPQSNRLQLKVQTGINASGAPTYATRGFNNVKGSATDADVYAAAQQLSSLQSHSIVAISTVTTSDLIEA